MSKKTQGPGFDPGCPTCGRDEKIEGCGACDEEPAPEAHDTPEKEPSGLFQDKEESVGFIQKLMTALGVKLEETEVSSEEDERAPESEMESPCLESESEPEKPLDGIEKAYQKWRATWGGDSDSYSMSAEIDTIAQLWSGNDLPTLEEILQMMAEGKTGALAIEFPPEEMLPVPEGSARTLRDMRLASAKAMAETRRNVTYVVLRPEGSTELKGFVKRQKEVRGLLGQLENILAPLPGVTSTVIDDAKYLVRVTGPARLLDPIAEVPGSVLVPDPKVAGVGTVADFRLRVSDAISCTTVIG